MRLYLFGPTTDRQEEFRLTLLARNYHVRGPVNILDKDDYMNAGFTPSPGHAAARQLAEMLEAEAVVITEECNTAEVLQLLTVAHFGNLRVVSYDDLPFQAIDCNGDILDRQNIVQGRLPERARSRVAQLVTRAWDVLKEGERRLNKHVGYHLKNPMTRPVRAEAGG